MKPVAGTRIAEALADSRQILHQAIAGISEEAAASKPDPDRWSVRDCVEHLAMAERGLLGRIAAAHSNDPLPADAMRESRVTAAVVNRDLKARAPERSRPAERFATLARALEEFDNARGETIRYALEHESSLALRTVQHPFFGAVTGLEMMLIMAGHVQRHADQIREIRSTIS